MLIIKECVDISWYLQKYLNLFHLCTDRLLLLLFTVHTMVNSELDSTKSSLLNTNGFIGRTTNSRKIIVNKNKTHTHRPCLHKWILR